MDKIAAWLDRHNVNLVAAFVTAILLVGAGIFPLKRLLQRVRAAAPEIVGTRSTLA
jgi:hypothetical protein